MNHKKIYGILKVTLTILLLGLMFFIMTFKTNDCSYCKFDVNGNDMKAPKFMKYYSEQCLKLPDESALFNISNYSYIEP